MRVWRDGPKQAVAPPLHGTAAPRPTESLAAASAAVSAAATATAAGTAVAAAATAAADSGAAAAMVAEPWACRGHEWDTSTGPLARSLPRRSREPPTPDASMAGGQTVLTAMAAG